MRRTYRNKTIVVFLLVSLTFSLCGCSGFKYHNIYTSALCGAAIGAVIGHQSDECENGALLGAAVFAVGDLLSQLDDQSKKDLEEAADEVGEEAPQTTVE